MLVCFRPYFLDFSFLSIAEFYIWLLVAPLESLFLGGLLLGSKYVKYSFFGILLDLYYIFPLLS